MSTYEPRQLEALRRAFEIAWGRIAREVDERPVAPEVARIILADIILGLTKDGNFDPPWLADNAVRIMLAKERFGGPVVMW